MTQPQLAAATLSQVPVPVGGTAQTPVIPVIPDGENFYYVFKPADIQPGPAAAASGYALVSVGGLAVLGVGWASWSGS